MSDQYVLWSVRGSGWFTRSSATHSDLKSAATYSRDEAMKMVRLHRGQYAPFGLLPVNLTMLDEAKND